MPKTAISKAIKKPKVKPKKRFPIGNITSAAWPQKEQCIVTLNKYWKSRNTTIYMNTTETARAIAALQLALSYAVDKTKWKKKSSITEEPSG